MAKEKVGDGAEMPLNVISEAFPINKKPTIAQKKRTKVSLTMNVRRVMPDHKHRTRFSWWLRARPAPRLYLTC